MLFVSGEVNGELYDRKKVTTKDLLDLFGAEKAFKFVNQDNPDSMVEYEYHGNVCKMKSGVLRHPNRYRVPAEMNGTYKGRSITITYATSERWDSKAQTHITLPKKINFGSKQKKVLNYQEQMEMIVWMYLHPSNASSPLRTSRTRQQIVWDLVNYEERASTNISTYEADTKVRMEILTDDPTVLERKARGLGISFGQRISNTRLRELLINSYEKHIKAGKRKIFIQKFNSAEVGISGQIQVLVDRGFIEKKSTADGRVFWSWKKGLKATGNICVVERGIVAIDHLKRTIINNFDSYDSIIREIMEGASFNQNSKLQRFYDEINAKDRNEENTPKTIEEMSDEEVVLELKMNDLVGYNRETKSIHFMSMKNYGDFLKDPLLAINVPKDWVQEAAVAMGDNMDLKASLREKLDKFKK